MMRYSQNCYNSVTSNYNISDKMISNPFREESGMTMSTQPSQLDISGAKEHSSDSPLDNQIIRNLKVTLPLICIHVEV